MPEGAEFGEQNPEDSSGDIPNGSQVMRRTDRVVDGVRRGRTIRMVSGSITSSDTLEPRVVGGAFIKTCAHSSMVGPHGSLDLTRNCEFGECGFVFRPSTTYHDICVQVAVDRLFLTW